MTEATRAACPSCDYANAPEALCCSMCGRLFRQGAGDGDGPARTTMARTVRFPSELGDRPRAAPPPVNEFREPLLFLGVGLLLAPVFAFAPGLRYMGWFLSSLFHETGHTAAAWFLGCPAFPAIRLDGHAAALHKPQVLFIALTVWASLAFATWSARRRRGWTVALGLATLIYPALAFTGAKELLHLLAGHLGELTFAAIFFWRALAGGFTQTAIERALYAVVAWYLIGQNLWLCARLVFSEAARAWYHSNGSFGLTNDYIRAANDVLGCSLEMVAAGMFVAGLAVLPLAFLIWRIRPSA
jgi:hypothetical protein